MKLTSTLLASVLVAVLSGCVTDPSASSSADYVYTNGKIYTVNPGQEWAEAVAVKGDTIVYVGDNAGAEAFAGNGTEKVDLQGRLVLPGFVESHIHVAAGAATTSGVILTTTDSLEGVLEKVETYAAENPHKKTIYGASYLSFLFGQDGPTKELLDKIIPDKPVLLMDHTLHAVWVNSKTYEVAGITTDTADPAGGEYAKNAAGELSGWIKGGPAYLPVLEAIEAITPEAIQNSIPPLLEGLSEYGFTSVIDMGAPFGSQAAFEALGKLDAAGELPLRMSVTYYVNTPSLADGAVASLVEYGKQYSSENIWFDTLKVSGDSVVENSKAAFLEPYLTTGDRGALYFDHDVLTAMFLPAAEKGFHITVHTIGDWATRTALDAFETVRKAGYSDNLLSTTHSQFVHPDDVPRYRELNVTVQTTGNWAVPIKSYYEQLGAERNDTRQFPFRSWADDGVNIALGADWPATAGGFEHGVQPFNNIYTAMHRRAPSHLRDEFGTYDATLPPEQEVLTLEECIYGYSMGGAKMLGIDDEVGSIEVGKKADVILLSQDLFEINPEQIPFTKVLATMFNGKIVHDVVYELGDSELVDVEDLADTAVGPCCRVGGQHDHR